MSQNGLFERLRKARIAREKAAPDLLRRRNVVACGVGYKSRAAQETGEPSIVVSVTKKLPAQDLSDDDLVPQSVEDVPTDVIETGEIRALAFDRRARIRPARPGISIGHVNGSAGTFGCVVQKDGELFLLTNNHVISLLNEAQEGDAILQPGPSDGGTLLDQIGTLGPIVPMKFLGDKPEKTIITAEDQQQPSGCLPLLTSLLGSVQAAQTASVPEPDFASDPTLNYVDAALARFVDPEQINADIVDIDGLPLGTIQPELGMRLIKSGRTTGLTQGIIRQFDVTVDVRYADRRARFTNQIMASAFSQPGDSGSLVLDYERNAVGLLFSGSDTVTVINPIDAVLAALRVNLVLGN